MNFLALAFLIFALSLFCLWYVMQRRFLETEKKMHEAFKSLSFEVMERSGRSFLDLATTSLEKYTAGAKVDLESRQKAIDASLAPLKESLKQLDTHQRELEKRREGAYSSLSKQIDTLVSSERNLAKETAQLSQALRSPQVRGLWGQIHLRRVVELAGLLSYCDFFEQKDVELEGKHWRPDLVVRLPQERQIVIDAKTPLNAYLDASDAGDDLLRKTKLQEHAVALRKHMRDLSSKEYWKQFDSAPEYVILFLPAEVFFSSALQVDPSLIEFGAGQNIIIATPTTLIAILRAVAFSWKQESLSKSAKEIAQLGQDLYDRIGIVSEHWNKVGKSLSSSVESYNQSVASFESRVLVSARKLKEVGSFLKEIPEPDCIEKLAKDFKVVETSIHSNS
jgi:DNA recombination protein RmuC